MNSKRTLWIVTPCFFDTPSFAVVRSRITAALTDSSDWKGRVHFVLIDDSAGMDSSMRELGADPSTRILTPPYNLGHQGALVYALRVLGAEIDAADFVVTMDSDGEDRPEDIQALVRPLLLKEGNLRLISIACRTKRKESFLFKLSYLGFKTMFRILSGVVVRNGNFAAFRGAFLQEVVFHPHFDQCYSSSLISLPMQIEEVPLARGTRIQGKSKMGFLGLFTHGIRMLMPFSERIAIRGMIFSTFLFAVSAVFLVWTLLCEGKIIFPVALMGLSFWTGGVSVLLFATFSQSKSRSLRAMQDVPRSGSKA